MPTPSDGPAGPPPTVVVDATSAEYLPFRSKVEECVQATLVCEVAPGDWIISVLLTDDLEMARYHQEFLGTEGPTDVMSWGTTDDFSTAQSQATGDVLVSCETAARQATALGHSWGREVCVLAVHGTLHLLGWDDATPEAQARMQRRVDEIVDCCLG